MTFYKHNQEMVYPKDSRWKQLAVSLQVETSEK